MEQHRAFEDKSVGLSRDAHAVEEPLNSVAGEHEIERLATALGQIQQALADGFDQSLGFHAVKDSK